MRYVDDWFCHVYVSSRRLTKLLMLFLPHCHLHAAKNWHSKRSYRHCFYSHIIWWTHWPRKVFWSSPPTNMPTNMLDILLNSIGGDKTTPDDQDITATANMLCENEMYQLFFGNDSLRWRCKKSKPRSTTVLLIGGKHQHTDSIFLRGLLPSTLQFLLHLPHLSSSGAKEVTSVIMYCEKNRELLHKYYAEIANERMHHEDCHRIERHKPFCLH